MYSQLEPSQYALLVAKKSVSLIQATEAPSICSAVVSAPDSHEDGTVLIPTWPTLVIRSLSASVPELLVKNLRFELLVAPPFCMRELLLLNPFWKYKLLPLNPKTTSPLESTSNLFVPPVSTVNVLAEGNLIEVSISPV